MPFWDAEGPPSDWINNFRFIDCPNDGTERIAILALNLLKPLAIVKGKRRKSFGNGFPPQLSHYLPSPFPTLTNRQ